MTVLGDRFWFKIESFTWSSALNHQVVIIPGHYHLNGFAGFCIAHKIKLPTDLSRSFGPSGPGRYLLCPLLTPGVRSRTITGPSVWFGALSSPDTPQASRGKFMYFRCTTAGFTPLAFDGYGLRDLMLTRPTETPCIQFLFVGSHLCYTLPSDPISR